MDGIIVCGLGHVGFRIVGLLRRLGEPVSVISLQTRTAWERWAEAEGIHLIKGDARDRSLLDEAGLDRARAVIAATDQDAVNVEVSLDVRERRPEIPVVLRLFDQTLAQQLERHFGVRAFGMSAVAAPSFVAAAVGERVLGSFAAGAERYHITRVEVTPQGPLSGATVGDITAKHGVAVIAYGPPSGEGVIMPPPDQQLEPHAHLIVAGLPAANEALGAAGSPDAAAHRRWRRSFTRLGAFRPIWAVWRGGPKPLMIAFLALNLLILLSVAVYLFTMRLSFVDAIYLAVTTTGYEDVIPRDSPEGLKLYAALVMILGSLALAATYSLITDFIVTSRFRELVGRREVPPGGHSIVVGLGNVGYRVAREAGSADQVAVIERDPATEFVEVTRRGNALVLGDGRVNETLQRASVSTARSVVAVTGDDATNLAIGLAARQLNPNARLVVRIFDADFAQKVRQSMGFQAVLSGSGLAAPTFVASALWPDTIAAIEFQRWLLVFRRCVWQAGWGQADEERHAQSAVLSARPAGDGPFRFGGVGRGPEPDDEIVALTWRPLVC